MTRTPVTELPPPSDLNPRPDPVLDFPERDYGSLTPDDYDRLGFLAGLEVHQQLATRTKLFCRCPSGVYTRDYDCEVLRHMRPTLSELGEYDGTALMEFKTRKEIVYRLNRTNVCTYEIDDTPPFPIDDEAVRIALGICLLFGLNPVSELHVMRKQYLDGSIPTGFQRTAMMGVGGSIPFRVPELGVDRELRIRQLSLEEDACREVSDVGHRITFLTDRLGMPLTEVVTEPDMLTPEELQAGARLVARVTREAARTRRGPGSARQDVNVSVAGGRRIEIKGVGRHRGLPRLVHREAFRQLNLLRIREELRRRGLTREAFEIPGAGRAWDVSPLVLDATRLLEGTVFDPLHQAIERGEKVAAVRLPELAGLLVHRTQPGRTFAHELADRVRVIACLLSNPVLLDSDHERDGVLRKDWAAIRDAMKPGRHDAMVLVWGSERDVDTAAREVLIRAAEALDGVPAETRQAYPDGSTGFERILPGADRMYPDTDTPPHAVPPAWVEEIRANLPEALWDREARYRKLGLSETLAFRLAAAPWREIFDAVKPRKEAVAVRLAHALEKRVPYHRRVAGREPSADRIVPLVRALEEGSIRLEAVDAALDALLEDPARDPASALHGFTVNGNEDRVLRGLAEEAAEDAANLTFSSPEARERWAMGKVMPELLGRADPALVREELRKRFSEGAPRV